MKKIFGWVLIIVCSLFLFFFAVIACIIWYDYINDISDSENIDVFGLMILGIFFIGGLYYGIKLVKKQVVVGVLQYDKILNISFTGKIEFKEYRNLMLGLTLKRKLYIYIVLISIISVFAFINDFFKNHETPNYLLLLYCLLFVALIPVFSYFQVKKLYDTNSIFKETLTYHLTNSSLQIIGQTVNSTQQWGHFVKIKEAKDFFLFYHGAQVATLLEKKLFTEQDLNEFKIFIQSLNIPKE